MPSCPPPLTQLLENPRYLELKTLFIGLRQDFKANPQALIDLQAYERGDNHHSYRLLKGLVPSHIVGNTDLGGGTPYGQSDTFFTDYLKHHTENSVLSSTPLSLIIGNSASYDVRQYASICYQDGKERTATAGMSFLHLLVIPRAKIYNVVSLDDAEVIEEMISHFKSFWASPESSKRSVQIIQQAVQSRTGQIHRDLERLDPESSHIKEVKKTLSDVQQSFTALSSKLTSLIIDDLLFAFHAAPHASIGHLHMHVLAMPEEFRQYSTCVHDWKTIPAKAVLEVLNEEKSKGLGS